MKSNAMSPDTQKSRSTLAANNRDKPWAIWLAAAMLGLVTFLIYLPVREFQFLNWDDLTYITENDHVRAGVTMEGLRWAFTEVYASNWHPLTWLSHMLDCQLFGLRAGMHHLVNVGFHLTNSLLLLALLRHLTGAFWRSVIVSAIFALHPLHVESVAWVSERKDVLSTFFGWLSLIAYTCYVRLPPTDRSRRWLAYALTSTFLALGLMSKAMLVTWPFVMLLLDFWPLRRGPTLGRPSWASGWLRLVLEKVPFLLLAVVSSTVTIRAQTAGGAVMALDQLPLISRISNAAVAYVLYLWKSVWPFGLSPFYPHPTRWPAILVFASFAVLLAITVLAIRARRHQPYLLFGWLFYLGTLVPVIGLVQVGSQALADRYTYIPLTGILIMLVWGGWTASRAVPWARIPIQACAICTIAGSAMITAGQVSWWRNTEKLFGRALQLAPKNYQALYILAGEYLNQDRFQEAQALLNRASILNPVYPAPHLKLGAYYAARGDYKAAMEHYRAAQQAGERSPEFLNNLAWILAACPDPQFRDGREAVRLARQACELTRFEKPVLVGTLAASYAQSGDFQKASEMAILASSLADRLGLTSVSSENKRLLKLYSEGKGVDGAPPHP